MISGMAGIMFRQLGWIVSIIMIVSTTAALTLVPMLCSQLLTNENKSGKLYHFIFDPVNRLLDNISSGYSKMIAWCMSHKKLILIGAAVIFAIVIAIYVPRMKTEYFPTADQGRIQVSVELPIGTAQDVTRELAERLYAKIVEDVPEIKVISYNFGQADSQNAFASMRNNGAYLISMNINIGSMEERKRSTAEISDLIRADLKLFPEINKSTVTEGGMGPGGRSSVQLEIYGYDFEQTEEVARKYRQKMLDCPAFIQVILSRDQYTPEYEVDFDREKLALNGLTSTTAAAAVSAAMSGTVASYYREDGEEYNIRVRFAPEFRESVEDIENIVIHNAAGRGIKVRDLGQVVESRVPPTITRKNRDRYITVTGLMARGHALSEGVEFVNAMMESDPLPPELSWDIGGDFEEQQSMFSDMILLMILIVILVYMVMASQFESFLGPLVIMFSIPFAFTATCSMAWPSA